ncbi:MAG: hypothetical protein F9K29_20230 [Hyphomicrobiaceae bacterium]|nr:MAG: hypothetical protein F9K29_20230 [Hyphomicrobiaceae bacterium]
MSWQAGGAVALLESFMPGITAWTRRGTTRREQPAICEPTAEAPPPGVSDKPVPREVLDALRLPPEAEQTLLDIGMPPDDSPVYSERKRKADTPEEAARKFVIWARAINATGTYPTGVICALYGECAAADHREPVSDNRFLYALKHTAGIRREKLATDRRRALWTIEPEPPKPVAEPEPVVAPKAVSKPALNRPRLLYRFIPDQEYSSPQLVRAKAKEARRLGRARKQRGGRASRRAM